MPKELDFMKTREEKGMPEEEFATVRGEYDKKAAETGMMVRKAVFIFMGALAVSFIAINIAALAVESFPQVGVAWLIAFPIVLAIFLYDPKTEADKKYKYETDQKIILKLLQGNIKLNKIRLGAVIAWGAISVAANIGAWWFIFDIMREMGGA